MPTNPEKPSSGIITWVNERIYWFFVNHRMSDILAAFFFGVIVGLWVA